MATPRKRWFKVADSILREPWDDRTLATAIRLMAWLNQRRQRDGLSDEQSCEALIGEHDAMAITRLRRGHEAVKFLSRLPLVAGWRTASASLVTICERSSKSLAVHLKWPKYAEFQSATTRKLPASFPQASPSDSDSDSDSENKTKKRTRRAAPRGRGEGRTAAPKPSAAAVAIFCEEYRIARGVYPAVDGKSKPPLGEALTDMGEERFRGACRYFFSQREDDWLRQMSFSATAFLARLTQCDVRAQNRAARPLPEPVPQPSAQIDEVFARAVIKGNFDG